MLLVVYVSYSAVRTGFDCIRTWEALAMGAVPIVLHSPMDRTFARLPVLFVDKYALLWFSMICCSP